jgi:hopene-associated glycosyltransferase HpnB
MAFVAWFGFAAWVYLIFLHRRFWLADQRLPAASQPLRNWPSVAAIVPARNEAETIAEVTAALRAQDYPGPLRVIVVDDSSSDGTAQLAQGEVIAAPPLPPGWTGKLAALNAGLAHAGETDFLWFTDADVVHPPATLTRLVSKAITDQRDMVSLMVRLRCQSFWERRLVPAFIYFFQMLYPFRAANDDRSRLAAAAGGCVLLRRSALQTAGGLEAIRGNVIDDCALAAAVKGAGGRIWLGLADAAPDASRSLRRADSLDPLWHMVSRTAFTQLRHSAGLLILTLIGLGLVFCGPPLAALTYPWHGDGWAGLAGLLAWAGMAWTYAPTLRDYGRSPWEGWILPVVAALYAAMTLDSGLAHWRGRAGQWKGRNYRPSSGAQNLPKSP